MAEIIQNEPITTGIYRMTVSGAPLGRAGQFFMLRVPGALDPLLGRPISICEIDESAGKPRLCIKPSGTEPRSLRGSYLVSKSRRKGLTATDSR